MKRIAGLLFLLAAGNVAAAQRFLVPIYLPFPVSGAFGSRWTSELTFLNTGTTPAYIQNYVPCNLPIGAPCIVPFFPRVSETVGLIKGFEIGGGIPAVLLLVDDEYADQLVFQTRVRDLSRTAQSHGAWLPVVPETDAVRGPVTLLDIPMLAGYRQTLRVYSFDHAAGRTVRVRVYGVVPADPLNPATYEQPNPLLSELSIPLRGITVLMPLYAEIGNLASLAGLAGYEKVWVSIEPEGSFGIWGMVSVTNNTTQEITMIMPHRTR